MSTSEADIVNRGLQAIGTRTTITSAELLAGSSNEAIQANIILEPLRDELLRMAPWDCALNFQNLNYITSAPSTPENTSPATPLWAKGQPPPPWVYEYQYPADCLRACWIVPQFATGFSGGIPITTAVTGGAPSFWNGPPVRYKVATDQFFSVSAATPVAGGINYVVGDQITLAQAPQGSAPVGAPAVLQVLTVDGGGGVLMAIPVPVIMDETVTGSYFQQQTNPQAQGSTTGVGTGATFNLTYTAKGDQRVILTNQEFAILAYVKRVTNIDIMDKLFQDAWALITAARMTMALTGDKALAQLGVSLANEKIIEARKCDANEGLTINDVTPDWIRTRGIQFDAYWGGINQSFDWGPMFTPY